MRRYYTEGQKVLANCGDKEIPDWIPGVITEVHEIGSRGISFPYGVKLEKESDGKTEWYFSPSYIIADNRRNRKRKGLI